MNFLTLNFSLNIQSVPICVICGAKKSSSKELPPQLSKTESTVSRWCTNDVQPSVEMLYTIAQLLDVDIRELLVSTKR